MAVVSKVADWLGLRGTIAFVFNCALLLALMIIVRPMFTAAVAESAYEEWSVIGFLIDKDIDIIRKAASSVRPAVPRLLFVLVPTVALMFGTKHKIRWGKKKEDLALRGLVMTIVIILCWAGAFYEYNTYLDRGHPVGRIMLVALAIIAWWRPLAIPVFTTIVVVMMREAKFPLGHDDFDWRPVVEVLILFSCYVWLSFRRSLRPKHFIYLALLCMGCYYWAAGRAKENYGPEYSWLLDNNLSNLFVSSYLHGWLSWLPEDTVMTLASWMKRVDVLSAGFTLVAETGAIILINAHPKACRIWLWFAALLHVGIYAFSGIFFWKWIVFDIAMWWFLRHGLAESHRAIFKHKLLLFLGAALMFYSINRVYFYPQTRVVWYDTKFNDVYPIYAIGESGARYFVNPRSLTPIHSRMTQEEHSYLTKKRHMTGVYGTTGSYSLMMDLEALKSPEEVKGIIKKRARGAYKKPKVDKFDRLMQRYFHTLNNHGWQHVWLEYVGCPDHIWVQHYRDDVYDRQERIVRIEVWREQVLYLNDAIHRLPAEKLHEVEIPAEAPPRFLKPPKKAKKKPKKKKPRPKRRGEK